MACSRQLIPGDEFALRDDGLFCKADHDVVEMASGAGSEPSSPASSNNNNNNNNNTSNNNKNSGSGGGDQKNGGGLQLAGKVFSVFNK